jgi:hypothetical protein
MAESAARATPKWRKIEPLAVETILASGKL